MRVYRLLNVYVRLAATTRPAILPKHESAADDILTPDLVTFPPLLLLLLLLS